MSREKNPNRQGFFAYLDTIRRIEKDKDAFCKAARVRNHPDNVYTLAIVMQQHAHEERMAKIASGIKVDE